MRSDPSAPLQAAVYAALVFAAPVTTDHIVHVVPQGLALPWVVIGQDQIITDYDSADVYECHVAIHVFSASMKQTKLIGSGVSDALDTQITISGFTVDEFYKVSARYFTDPDGQTAHGVLEFQYNVQATG